MPATLACTEHASEIAGPHARSVECIAERQLVMTTRYTYNAPGITLAYAGTLIVAAVFAFALWLSWFAEAWFPLAFTIGAIILVGYWGVTLGIGVEVRHDGIRLRRMLGLGWRFVPYEYVIMARLRTPSLEKFDRPLLLILTRRRPAFWICGDLPPGWPRFIPGLQPIFPDYDRLVEELKARLEPLAKFQT